MNNYDYEYKNYTNNISNNNILNYPDNFSYSTDNIIEERINYMPNLDNYKIQFMNQPKSNINTGNVINKGDSILEPYQGFIRGNMFRYEYEGYKNYKPMEVNSSNERENLLNQLQLYMFALIDLDLYLDVNPNDNKAISLYNNYLNIKDQICKKYESMYGPLSLYGNFINKNSWDWISNPWPWEEI